MKVNTWKIIKASTIITMFCNCTFYFLHELRLIHLKKKIASEWIKFKVMPIKEKMPIYPNFHCSPVPSKFGTP